MKTFTIENILNINKILFFTQPSLDNKIKSELIMYYNELNDSLSFKTINSEFTSQNINGINILPASGFELNEYLNIKKETIPFKDFKINWLGPFTLKSEKLICLDFEKENFFGICSDLNLLTPFYLIPIYKNDFSLINQFAICTSDFCFKQIKYYNCNYEGKIEIEKITDLNRLKIEPGFLFNIWNHNELIKHLTQSSDLLNKENEINSNINKNKSINSFINYLKNNFSNNKDNNEDNLNNELINNLNFSIPIFNEIERNKYNNEENNINKNLENNNLNLIPEEIKINQMKKVLINNNINEQNLIKYIEELENKVQEQDINIENLTNFKSLNTTFNSNYLNLIPQEITNNSLFPFINIPDMKMIDLYGIPSSEKFINIIGNKTLPIREYNNIPLLIPNSKFLEHPRIISPFNGIINDFQRSCYQDNGAVIYKHSAFHITEVIN